jgi:anti-sigma regulatory factor (Ser/Thr protein kinase)
LAADPRLTRDVPLDTAAVEAVQDEIAEFLEGAGVASAVRYRLRLIIEELLANLIMHGRFDGDPPPARLEVAVGGDALLLTIDDAAAPYDPRLAPEPAGPPRIEDDTVGGLGLSLVRKMADIRAYHRLPHGWNRTEMALPLDEAGKA